MAEYNNKKSKRDLPPSFRSSNTERIVTDWSGYDAPTPTDRFDAYHRQDSCPNTQHGNYDAMHFPDVSLEEPDENSYPVAPSEMSQTRYHRDAPQSFDYSSLASRRIVDSQYQVVMDAKDQGERNAQDGCREATTKVEYGPYSRHARPCPIPVPRLDSGSMGAVAGYEMSRSIRHRPEPRVVDASTWARPKEVRVGLDHPQGHLPPSRVDNEDCPKCKAGASKRNKPGWLCRFHYGQTLLFKGSHTAQYSRNKMMATEDLGDCRLDFYEQDAPVEKEMSPYNKSSHPVARWHRTASQQWDSLPIEDDAISGVQGLSGRGDENLPDCIDTNPALGGTSRSMEDEDAEWRDFFCGTGARSTMLDSRPTDTHDVSTLCSRGPSDTTADSCHRCIEGRRKNGKANYLCKSHYNRNLKQLQRLEKHKVAQNLNLYIEGRKELYASQLIHPQEDWE